MGSQQFAVFAVLSGTLALNGWVAAGLVGLGSRSIENDAARIAVDKPQATAIAENSVHRVSVQGIIDAAFSALPFDVPEMESILAALPDPHEMLAPVAVASATARRIQCKKMSRCRRPLSKSPRWRAFSLPCLTLRRCWRLRQ